MMIVHGTLGTSFGTFHAAGRYPVYREPEGEDFTCLRLDVERLGLTGLLRDVAELLADGHPERQVADLLGISRGKVCRSKSEIERRLVALGLAAGGGL